MVKMVSVRLDADIENELNRYAELQNVPKSKIIRDSLLYYFDMLKTKQKRKTPYELGNELFGKYGSGKGDLSVTYKQRLKEKLSEKSAHR